MPETTARPMHMGTVRAFEITACESDPGRLWIVATTTSGSLVYAKADRIWLGPDGNLCWSLGDVKERAPDVIETGNEARAQMIGEAHVEHYRHCGCLGDSAVCCVESCPCHIGGQP